MAFLGGDTEGESGAEVLRCVEEVLCDVNDRGQVTLILTVNK